MKCLCFNVYLYNVFLYKLFKDNNFFLNCFVLVIVLVIFSDLKVDVDLFVFIFGESVLNDVVVIVFLGWVNLNVEKKLVRLKVIKI